MALFKILKGPEKKDSTGKSVMLDPVASGLAIKEGWAYVTDAGNFYVDISDTTRVKINQNADFSVKAENDSSNQKITDTYIKDVVYHQSGTSPYYTLILGSGNTKETNGVTDQVTIPVANTTDAGVVTIGKQTFAGEKIFNALITAKLGLTSNENISTEKQLVSTIANGTAPLAVSSKTLVPNLNADTVDGLHASNNLFNAENSSETILPTQRAIWSSLNSLLVAAHALVYRGIIDPTNSKTHPNASKVGDVYIISKEGEFAGVYCEPGDMAIYYASGWDIIQVNINGAVTIKSGGAYDSAHATTNAISRFDNTTGRVIKNSKVIIDDTGNIVPVDKNAQNIGSKDYIWNTIYGTTFTGTSNQAVSDDSGQVIKNTYIKEIAYVQNDSQKNNSKSKPYLKYLLGKGTDPIYLPMPLAGAKQGGIITAEAQNISGVKTLNETDGGLIIPRADSFQYSGIQEDTTTGTEKYIWFSAIDGIPKYNTGLAFNPAYSIQWSHDSNKVTTAVLTVSRLNGLALQALQDSQGKVIDDTYIQDVILNNDISAPYYTLQLGNGTFKDIDGVTGPDQVIIPVASATQAGIITADKANAQTITGAKIIDANGSLEIKKAEGFNYSGIQNGTATGARSVWFSHLNYSGTPCVNASFKFDPEEALNTTNWSNEASGTKSSVLHVPHIDGLAYKALRDSQGLVIDDTYIKDITLTNHATAPYYTLTLGNGTLKKVSGNTQQVLLPVAGSSYGGIITNAIQSISGKKTFLDGIAIKLTETDTSATYYPWFSTIDSNGIGTPVYSTNFSYNVSTNKLTATTFAGNLEGNAASATKLETARTISLTGSVTGSGSFDGSGNLNIETTINNSSDGTYYVKIAGDTMTGNLTAPSVYTSDWFRSTGSTGWYNETYGGGWHMTDSTYIRNYNNKAVRMDDVCLGADNNSGYRLYVNGDSFFNGLAWFSNDQYLTHRSGEGYVNMLAETFFRPCRPGGTPMIDGYTVPYTSSLGSKDYVQRFIGATTGAILFPYSYWRDTYATAGDASSGITNTEVYTGYFTLRQRSPTNKSTTSPYTNYYENYRLPFPEYERTSTITYWLLTTKNTSLTAINRMPYISSTSWGGGFSTSNHYVNSTQIGVNQTTQPSTTYKLYVNGYAYGTRVYGAVWNDYAEYRQSNIQEPGRCIVENGDDTLSLSSSRLQLGAEIVSDTYGFAIGETDDCKTPVATTGRVLAYPYESQEVFRNNIGRPVCSGPNGTVSIMTPEEEQKYPSAIIGTISSVPDYEEWGTGKVKVNGRIWLRIR